MSCYALFFGKPLAMRSRQTLIETFSTFLQFEGDVPSQWVTDARLRRSMQQCLGENRREQSEQFWALYWYKRWVSALEGAVLKARSQDHLAAYLQEACYWSARRILAQFSTLQFTVADCFQIAIVRVQKVLQGFDPHQGFSLANYASALFSSTIRDILRQRQEVDICTNWALLRKVSQKRLTEALQQAGYAPDTVQSYVLAWQGFKQIYVPTQATGSRKLPKPDAETWSKIAAAYHAASKADRPRQSALLPPETLEHWLNTAAQAVRTYLNPSLVSINAPKLGQDSGELLDDLTDADRESLLSELIAEEEAYERKTQRQDLSQVLAAAIAQSDPELQQILDLYYRQQHTQQEMADALGLKQYTISRRLTRAKERLLKQLALWSRDTLHTELTPALIDSMGTLLEEWLQQYYGTADRVPVSPSHS